MGHRDWWAAERVARGNRCQDCGQTWRTMQFHHRDPRTKRFSLGSAPAGTSKEDWEDEATRCDLLCRSCHAARHVSLRALGYHSPSGPVVRDANGDTPRQALWRRQALQRAARRSSM